MRMNSLPPIVIQLVGLAMAVFFAVFWVVTGRVEFSLLGLAGTLVSVGTAAQGRKALKDEGGDQ